MIQISIFTIAILFSTLIFTNYSLEDILAILQYIDRQHYPCKLLN